MSRILHHACQGLQDDYQVECYPDAMYMSRGLFVTRIRFCPGCGKSEKELREALDDTEGT